MRIHYTDRFTVDLCRANAGAIFCFGDNLIKSGEAGQAIIRREPNAFGIPTKRYPATTDHSYFSDAEREREHVKRSLRELYSRVREGGVDLFWPRNGIGTGLAQMPRRSPIIYSEMCDILLKHFGVKNG